jgi:hypothetical protein
LPPIRLSVRADSSGTTEHKNKGRYHHQNHGDDDGDCDYRRAFHVAPTFAVKRTGDGEC